MRPAASQGRRAAAVESRLVPYVHSVAQSDSERTPGPGAGLGLTVTF